MKIASYHHYFNKNVSIYVALFVTMETMTDSNFINEKIASLKNRRVLFDVAKVNFVGRNYHLRQARICINNSDGG